MPQHTYSALGTYTVSLTVTGSCGSAVEATQAVIQQACLALAFTKGGNRNLHLNSSRPSLCVQIEPQADCYRNEDVLTSSIVMKFSGGAVPEIHAITDKTTVDTDTNNDGIPEISACFRKEDLRQLFSGLPNGTSTVEASLEADLSTGGRLSATLDLRVSTGGGSSAVTVAPNPFNPAGILTFATSRSGPAKLELFDAAGRLVTTILEDPALAPGVHEVTIGGRTTDGRVLASGIYFIRGSSTEGTFTKAVAILK
jgi:PKD repeat protein